MANILDELGVDEKFKLVPLVESDVKQELKIYRLKEVVHGYYIISEWRGKDLIWIRGEWFVDHDCFESPYKFGFKHNKMKFRIEKIGNFHWRIKLHYLLKKLFQ